MSENTNQVNQEPKITIQRGKHNKENPYVMISKKMLRDPELSLKDKGMLCYLLSLPDDWVTHASQIALAVDIGREQVQKIFKKLIQLGYMTRTFQRGFGARFESISYQVYEEKLENPQQIKEKIPETGFPRTVFPCTVNQALLSNDCLENTDVKGYNTPLPLKGEVANAPSDCDLIPPEIPKKEKKSKQPLVFSDTVKEFALLMIKILMDNIPTYRPPANMNLFHEEVRIMLEVENQNPEEMIKYFTWACKDNIKKGDWDGWSCIVARNKIKRKDTSPAHIFREHLSMICQKCNSMPERKFSPCSDDAASLKKWEEASKRAII